MWNWTKKVWKKWTTQPSTPVREEVVAGQAAETVNASPSHQTTARTVTTKPILKVSSTVKSRIPKGTGTVLANSGFRRDKQAQLFCVLNVQTLAGAERVFCWKRNLPAPKWSLAIKLKKGDQINYQGRSWAGGFQATNLVEVKEKISWSTVERELAGLRLAFLDIETVTSCQVSNTIAEVAYQIYEEGALVLEKSFLVQPTDMRLARTVNVYNNIPMSQIRKAQSWAAILPQVQEDLAGTVIISHNFKGFDYHCLQKGNFFQKNLTYYFFDTLTPAKLLMKEKNWEGKSDLQNLIRKIRQDETFVEKHRALPDALLHKELFDYLIQDKPRVTLLYRVH